MTVKKLLTDGQVSKFMHMHPSSGCLQKKKKRNLCLSTYVSLSPFSAKDDVTISLYKQIVGVNLAPNTRDVPSNGAICDVDSPRSRPDGLRCLRVVFFLAGT